MTPPTVSFDTFKPEPEVPIFDSLMTVEKEHGIGVVKQLGDILRLCFLRRRITPQDYYRLGVFAAGNGDTKAQDAFIGDHQVWRLNFDLSDRRLMHSLPVIDTKVVHWMIMKYAGIPVPEMQAFQHPLRSAGPIPALRDAVAVARFLRSQARYPLFGKPVSGLGSLGAASITRYDPESDSLVLLSGENVGVKTFAEDAVNVYGSNGYLFQSRIEQHPDVAAICGASVGTVRLVTLRSKTTPVPFYAVWKLPRSNATADNFWRAGNMIAHLDLETGQVLRVQQGAGVHAREIERHPDTGEPLIGWQVPHWDRILAESVRGAELTPDLRIMGWDVAVGPDGPILIEGNETPDHVLYQLAARRGIMTPEFTAIMQEMQAENHENVKRLKSERKAETATRRSRQRAAFVSGIDISSIFKDRR